MAQRAARGGYAGAPGWELPSLIRGGPTSAMRAIPVMPPRKPDANTSPRSPSAVQRSLLEPQTPKGQREQARRDNRVQVAVRLRPVSKADGGGVPEIAVLPDGEYGVRMSRAGAEKEDRRFHFDHVFTQGQEEVYDCLGRPMLRDAVAGYNVTLFAYGQTASGKTWSIVGPEGQEGEAGLLPRFCRDLLEWAQAGLERDAGLSVKIALSMLEIYNEKVRDLLEMGRGELTSLDIHETKDRRIFVEGLSLHTVTTYARFLSLTKRGLANRQVHETNMNESSSRSHCVIQIYLAQTHDPPRPDAKDVEAVINIVDLAGSERQGKAASCGERFEESKKINHSLVMLGRALNTFSDSDGKADFVPLRDSKLTRLLSESFGGNARTWMLACVSPAAYNYHESLSTLQYAQNAKAIVSKAKVNAMREKLELKQLQHKYAALEKLYDQERLKAQQLMLELQARGDRLQLLQRQLDVALLPAKPLTPPLAVCIPGMYVGRAHLHLKNILEQTSNYVTLPLVTDRAECDGALLVVSTYPLRKSKAGPEEEEGGHENGAGGPVGRRLELVVHVIGARAVPEPYCHAVHCKYVFKHDEQVGYETQRLPGPDPEFDFKKRFAFGSLTPALAAYLATGNVLTFEVFGRGAGEPPPPLPPSPPALPPFAQVLDG